jgi:hypothetical protein
MAIQPIEESVNSNRRRVFETPKGLKKKKLGKVATTSQYTIKTIAPKSPTM